MNLRLSVLFCSLLMATAAHADTVFPISTSAELVTLLSNAGGGSVPDGGVIEMAAGTYIPPGGGFLILDPQRSFTIRAETPGTVILDGQGTTRIFRFIVNSSELGGAVVFDGLTFRDGVSSQPAFGGAMTLQTADATFIDCVFEDNAHTAPSSGSGAVGIRDNATALFLRSTWQDNTSLTSGAGAVIVTSSTLWCHECQFLRNKNNLPDHLVTATGAGFVATSQSSVYISNSRFEDNEAGFAGGAFDLKGLFTEATPALAVISNSTFEGNVAFADPSVTTNSPTVGGVANVEDNAIARFYNSRLLDNSAQFGGAIGVYRAALEVYDSVLKGNFATGRASTSSNPRGGAIFAVSDDSAGDGTTNRPPSDVIIRDSLFHGELLAARAGGQTAASHTGGCVYTSGDLFRHLGLGGVPQGGTQAQNSATLDISGTAFVDCDVTDLVFAGPFGGGAFTELAIVSIDDSLFIDGDATSSDPSGAGGALALLRFTDAEITDTVFANNSSAGRGGAIFSLGATLDIDGASFIKNSVPGSTVGSSRGAALFLGPQDGAELGIDGVVRNSLFADNAGLAIYDDDRSNGTGWYNLVTYEANSFFETTFPQVYRNTQMGGVGSGIVDVAGLNAMVVDRGGGNTTDKAPANDNLQLGAQPVVGKLLAVPPQVIDATAAGDLETSTTSSLAYAWCGSCAELDGQDLTNNTGLQEDASVATHSLMVFDTGDCSGAPDFDGVATVSQAPTPTTNLTADPVMISGGETSNLSWDTAAGTFLESALDQREGVLGAASGSVDVSPSLTTEYTFFAITEEGGAHSQETVFVDEPPDDLIFSDGFESGDTSFWN